MRSTTTGGPGFSRRPPLRRRWRTREPGDVADRREQSRVGARRPAGDGSSDWDASVFMLPTGTSGIPAAGMPTAS
jgi:hypothetical protein